MFTVQAMTEFFGFAAATLTTVAFFPQLLKVYRSRSAKDISLPMFLLFSTGVFFWLLYGIMLKAIPIIFANIITLSFALAILFLKVKYDRKSR